MTAAATMFSQSYFHGTRADLAPGDEIRVGHVSNFADTAALSWVYFTSTLDAAIWGAELAKGEGKQRIYVVEPTGAIVDDPNLTDKKFPRQSDTILPLARAVADHCRSRAVAGPRAGADTGDEGWPRAP